MPESIFAQPIDFSKSEQYTLSIRLRTDGFSFSVFVPTQEEATHYFHHAIHPSLSLTANLKQALPRYEFLSCSYKRVFILSTGNRYTSLPLEFYDPEEKEVIFYHNHPHRDNEIVLGNTLKREQIVFLFGMEKSAYQLLLQHYPQARFYNQAFPLAGWFAVKSKLGNSRKMLAFIRSESIDILCYERGRLLLANSFTCQHTEDRVYYLLYVWKQLRFDQRRDELHLAGTLTEKEKLLAQLRRFIGQVFILNPSEYIDMEALLTLDTD